VGLASLRSSFPTIASYGFVSDCHTSVLVAPQGWVEWLCIPRFDSPSAFGALLDRGAGSVRIGPPDVVAPISRRYLPGTLILETTWTTPSGWLVVVDALTITEWAESGRQERAMQRPHPRQEADRTLVRIATCVDGEVEVDLDCEPRFEYGSIPASWERNRNGLRASGGDQWFDLTTDIEPAIEDTRAWGRATLREKTAVFSEMPGSREEG
jgi:GH15 family glucan-1,4-alpha-glucosidase